MSFAPTTAQSHSKLKRSAMFVAAGLVAATLAIGVPTAANAATAPTVSSNVTTASVNGHVTLTVEGFQPNETLAFTLDSVKLPTFEAAGSFRDAADGAGKYVGDAYIPVGTSVGTHTLTVTGDTTAAVSTPLTIVAQPTATVKPSKVTLSAYLKSGVTATFKGFTPGDVVAFGIGGGNMGGQVGSNVTVDKSGTVSLTFLPKKGESFSTVGAYSLGAGTAAGNIAAEGASFTVTADPAPVKPAAPATPVKATASFTG